MIMFNNDMPEQSKARTEAHRLVDEIYDAAEGRVNMPSLWEMIENGAEVTITPSKGDADTAFAIRQLLDHFSLSTLYLPRGKAQLGEAMACCVYWLSKERGMEDAIEVIQERSTEGNLHRTKLWLDGKLTKNNQGKSGMDRSTVQRWAKYLSDDRKRQLDRIWGNPDLAPMTNVHFSTSAFWLYYDAYHRINERTAKKLSNKP